ncbi:MAG: IS66 family transposase [Candidatus Omnitrophota bacterium]
MTRKEIEQILLRVKTLEEENEKLKEENAYLRFELEDLRSKRYKSGRKRPPDEPDTPMSLPKKIGGLFGHVGWFRKKPERIDRIEELRLTACPVCGSRDINQCKKTQEHIQEDIILPRVEAVMYKRHYYYCKKCKKVVAPQGKDEIPGSYIGPKAKAFANFLRYVVKISERDVKMLFERAFNLKIVPSSITGFRGQLKKKALPAYSKLMEALRIGPFIHADETGWKVDGDNHWLWKFSNKRICVSHIDKSRGQNVVDKMIGDKYKGVLISDFLSAYNKIDAKAKQRCLVHIMRDLKKVIEYWRDDREVLRYCQRLKDILGDAIALHGEYINRRRDGAYYRRREALTEALKDFSFPNPNKRILKRFAKRLMRHKDEILTFLYQKNIDYHNNHAEQQIRPDVIFRKLTFGNRSPIGAQNHSVIMSVLQTAKLNGIDPIAALEKILLKSPQNPLVKALSP